MQVLCMKVGIAFTPITVIHICQRENPKSAIELTDYSRNTMKECCVVVSVDFTPCPD